MAQGIAEVAGRMLAAGICSTFYKNQTNFRLEISPAAPPDRENKIYPRTFMLRG